jgi:hypothetical protein
MMHASLAMNSTGDMILWDRRFEAYLSLYATDPSRSTLRRSIASGGLVQ